MNKEAFGWVMPRSPELAVSQTPQSTRSTVRITVIRATSKWLILRSDAPRSITQAPCWGFFINRSFLA